MSRAASVRGSAVNQSVSAPRNPPVPLDLGYFERSQLPLTCLFFLLPMLIFYEVGTSLYARDVIHHTETRIRAFDWMQKFFRLCGAHGRYLPALAVVGILLAWHVARKDLWEFRLSTPILMAIESISLSLPVFVLHTLSAHCLPLAGASMEGRWPAKAVLSIGAGIYEELVFRLICMTVLSILLSDLLRVRKGYALLLMVVCSAVLFSAYHYLGAETWSLRNFAFRAAAGVYFGIIFFMRGFGITAGAHAAYDLILLTWLA